MIDIESLIPENGNVMIVAARMVRGHIMLSSTEVSLEVWEFAPSEKIGGLIVKDLQKAEKRAGCPL